MRISGAGTALLGGGAGQRHLILRLAGLFWGASCFVVISWLRKRIIYIPEASGLILILLPSMSSRWGQKHKATPGYRSNIVLMRNIALQATASNRLIYQERHGDMQLTIRALRSVCLQIYSDDFIMSMIFNNNSKRMRFYGYLYL